MDQSRQGRCNRALNGLFKVSFALRREGRRLRTLKGGRFENC